MSDSEIVYPIRLNRYLALRGFATRRKADELITAGLVRIDGRVAKIGDRVEQAHQEIIVGKEASLFQKDFVYYVYYKPRGIITHSPQGKETSIGDIVSMKGVFPVGRLDKDSEGLMILTNDGRVTERLLHPRFEHEKEYVVTIQESWPREAKALLETGIVENGDQLRAKRFTPLGKSQASIILTEGKKHQIRRMLGSLGLTVTELRRIRIMGVHLGSLRPGEKRALSGKAKASFLHDLDLQ